MTFQPSRWLQVCWCVLCLPSRWAAQCFLPSAVRNETGSSQMENHLHHHKRQSWAVTLKIHVPDQGEEKHGFCYNPTLKSGKHPECTAACSVRGREPADCQCHSSDCAERGECEVSSKKHVNLLTNPDLYNLHLWSLSEELLRSTVKR